MRNRGTRTHRVPADLHQNDRFQPRRRAQAGQEAPRIAHTLDVEQDVFSLGIVDQIVDDFAEIDIPRTTHQDHAGETDLVGTGPVEHRRTQHPRLRYQTERTGQRIAAGKGGVEANGRPHDAEAIRTDQAHPVPPRVFQQFALKAGTLRAGLRKTGCNHHHRPLTGCATLRDQLGTVSRGVAVTARSTRCGTLSTGGQHGTPLISLCRGLTAYSAPRYRAASLLLISTAPTEPARVLAPMIATEAGKNRGSGSGDPAGLKP